MEVQEGLVTGFGLQADEVRTEGLTVVRFKHGCAVLMVIWMPKTETRLEMLYTFQRTGPHIMVPRILQVLVLAFGM